MMYYKIPDGTPTTNIQGLIPSVINPSALSEDELLQHGVATCVVNRPNVEWWQDIGEKVVDTSVTPHQISWLVVDREVADVKTVAWQRIKDERDMRQHGLMPHTYPSGVTHHNEMTEKVIRDLSASTTAALALASMGVVDPVMPWTTYENVTHMLTPAQMIAFGLTATQWHSAIHVQSQTIRAAINAAEDVAGVIAAVVWPGV